MGWADVDHPADHPDYYVEDPYAPHVTNGQTARLGTAVGFIYNQPSDVVAIGATAAIGQRFNRLALEAEYSYLSFQSRGQYVTPLGVTDGDVGVGHGQRLGVLARYDVIRFGSNVVGPNSMLAIYVEGGAGMAWNTWSKPDYNQGPRIVPADTKRPEGQVGFGLMLDHRLQEPIGFPRRIGWFLGWRMAMSPHSAEVGTICRSTTTCSSVQMTDSGGYVDQSMLFQSSIEFTF